MAQTLKIQASLSNETDGGFAGSRSFTVTTTGNGAWQQKASVGTTEEEWVIDTQIGNAGRATVRNLDSTNYVEYGTATGVYPFRVNAGESDSFRLNPSTASIFLKANTAACVVQVYVAEA